MSLYNLDRMLDPSSVAVIGASERWGSVGRAILDNLTVGGFGGDILPINPNREDVLGLTAYPSLEAAGRPVDLVVVATPITTAPEIIRECSRLGCGAAVIVSAGGKEAGEDGLKMEELIRREAYQGRVRIVGPNCLGIINARSRLNASFAHEMPMPGNLAFISQSGAICTAVLDYAVTEQIGFSHVISVGSMLDVDFGDLIDYLGNDPDVSSILLYVENITHHRKFLSAARSVSRVKPIIVLKTGRYEAGAKAAMSHTGAMAGEDAVYQAAFNRAGIVRVDSLEDLFGCAELAGKQKLPAGPRLAIITNAGGPGVMAADYLASWGMEPAELSPETKSRLDAVLPRFWSRSNPVDILGDAPPEKFRQVVDICMTSGDFDSALITTTVQAMNHPTDIARAIIPALKARNLPVFTAWLGGRGVVPAREMLNRNLIPTYDSVERAIRAFVYMYKYGRNLQLLRQVPPRLQDLDYDEDGARALIERALADGRTLLSETEAKRLLAFYGIPVSPTVEAATPEDAAARADELGYPVVLKLLSPDITHKSDAGGVRLDLRNELEVRQAFDSIMASAAAYSPSARLDGVTVQPMAGAEKSLEIIIGAKKDPDFGPVILFGMGGTTAELFKDRAVGLPPLDRLLARRLMEGARIFRLLKGYRDVPPANLPLLEEILIRLSLLVSHFPEIAELDVNPVKVFGDKAIGVDARVVIEKTGVRAPAHLSILPYPNHYEFRRSTRTGRTIFVRPVKPEDTPLMAELWGSLSPRSIYQRFLGPVPRMDDALLARFTQIDYNREMAIVAIDSAEGRGRIVGVARLMQDPDGQEAELGMSVGDPWQGQGVGEVLLDIALAIGRDRGLKRIWSRFFNDNEAAMALGRKRGRGFEVLEDGKTVRVAAYLDDTDDDAESARLLSGESDEVKP